MTKKKFLEAYRAHLIKTWGWAKDEAKLNRFMSSVEQTVTGKGNTWCADGDAMQAAWREIGGTGRCTLKALRALTSQLENVDG